ncbi:hypothetical protein L7F22_031185 [Adiantum nelumboides]|nr:hypothetical protein [Adiantum nelumboides]
MAARGGGAGGVEGLPPGSSLSPTLRALLNHQFKSMGDLANAPSLFASLSSDLHASQQRLSDLHCSITTALAAWASLSHSTSSSLACLGRKLHEFSAEAPGAPTLDSTTQEEFIGQLPVLAAEVARVERVRLYAETALRLEALVGDLEDAVASIVVGGSQVQLPRKMANSPTKDLVKHPKMQELLQGTTQVVSSLPSEKEDSHAKVSQDTRGKAPRVKRQQVVKTPSRASGSKDFVAFGHGTVNESEGSCNRRFLLVAGNLLHMV